MAKYGDLATEKPELANEWHPVKNGVLCPSDVTVKSGKTVWWLGKCGHEWQSKICTRADGSGCPFCSNHKVLSGYNDLESAYPNLAKEWHPTKNGKLIPKAVASKSNKKVWWIGQCGHEWQAVIEGRVAGNGCPICASQQILVGFNDLSTIKPDLATEWHPTKNGELKPTMVMPQSGKKVWWLGKCGHEWQAAISMRTNNTGCPICANTKILLGYNDLMTTNIELAKEWHPSKNNGLTPKMFTSGSQKKIWWICKKGHEWQAKIKDRTNGNRCPICTNRKVLKGFNDLATTYPHLVKEWHPIKNGGLKPDMVTAMSHKKIWWICEKGHEWQVALSGRSSGNNCPVCSKEMHTSFPEQALFFYISKLYPDVTNGDKATIGIELDIYIPSLKIAIEYDGLNWHKNSKTELKKNKLCKESGIKLIRIREEGLGLLDDCCCVIRKDLKHNNSMDSVIQNVLLEINPQNVFDVSVDRDASEIYELYIVNQKSKSLKAVAPLIASEWHPTKNGVLQPEMVSYGSGKTIWWQCQKGHEWKAAIADRVHGNGCPICANQQVLLGYNDLQTLDPTLANQWHPTKNGALLPSMITPKANKKVWWICGQGHEWQALVSSRSNGRGCPICSNKMILPGYNDLLTINPDLAKEWHPTKNGELQPNMVAPRSGKKVWWICDRGHEWQATICDRANGTRCPLCRKQK